MISYYTGIGSRKTPIVIQEEMTRIASVLNTKRHVLRSGHADGADKAFESGAGDLADIFLPWRGFNGSSSPLFKIAPEAFEMARKYHPRYDYLSKDVQKLMARNCYQILGADLATPSNFVICWTPDGCSSKRERTVDTGGTGQVIAIASDHGIPVYNLKRLDHYNLVIDLAMR